LAAEKFKIFKNKIKNYKGRRPALKSGSLVGALQETSRQIEEATMSVQSPCRRA
jgi:hypothetical protein